MSPQYGEHRPTNGWDPSGSLRPPLQISTGFASWQRYCTASSSRRQANFAELNRGRHLCSAGRPSGWATITLGIGPHSSCLWLQVTSCISRPSYRSSCVNWHPILRPQGFYWSEGLLPTCPCWWQLAHWDYSDVARVFFSGVTYTTFVGYVYGLSCNS